MSDWFEEMNQEIAESKARYDEKIEAQQKKHSQRMKRWQLEENRLKTQLSKAQNEQRKMDTRRLIIEGRLWRLMRKEQPELEVLFQERLEGYLEEKDRWLFGFEEEESSG